ncbi:MAG TPA: hypothetical protein DCK87_02070 [Desulfotomaculum sp.]|nr:hypothetical protein [Desulfotomaculum sp.]
MADEGDLGASAPRLFGRRLNYLPCYCYRACWPACLAGGQVFLPLIDYLPASLIGRLAGQALFC